MTDLRLKPTATLALLGLVFVGTLCGSIASPVVDEYAVKAGFLFNFAKFTSWPQAADQTTARRVCIAGTDPFDGRLEIALQDKHVRGRTFSVERYSFSEVPLDCDIVFVGSGDGDERLRMLAALRDRPILTIGESETFLQDGGVIRFYSHQQRIRFAVNVDAMQRTGLRVSSKLLQLAVVVQEGG